MKRTLTGIAAAAVTLGAVAPMAFAATGANNWNYNVASQLPIVLNGSVLSNPYELTAKDSGNTTAYFPVYYFNQALSKIGSGFSATWDGVTHTWAIKAPNVDASKISIAGGVGTGNTTITVNGTVIKKINTGAAKDPAGGGMTTYFPAYYINEIFNSLGAKVSFSGQTGLAITANTTQNTAGSKLSNITISGESSGDGSSASPAVSLSNKAITVSTTLTDANGNSVANTAVSFEVSEYGTKPNNMPLPTVTNSNGTVISGTSSSDHESYTAYTDAQGVASLTLAGPAGQTYAYEVVATAPYQGKDGMTVSSSAAYTEFVANNQAAITPYANSDNAFGATMGKGVPITVALPLNTDGSARANVLVSLTASGNGYFTNSNGADLGQTIQVSTNASGIAQAWLNDSNSEAVKVSASLPAGIGLNDPQPTYINFAQSGIASRVNNYSISSTNLESGQDVTVSGQLVDAAGNPVANGQVLVVGNDSGNSGDFGYVTTSNSKSTTTDFPNVGPVSGGWVAVAQGFSASSTTGDVVTADSNGNFSFVVTDTGDSENATFSIYAVSNGEVASSSALKSDTIDFTAGTTLTSIALGGTDSQAQGNTYTSLTGLSASDNSNTTVYVDPQNAAGNPITGQSFNYNLSVGNGGTVTGIVSTNGSVLPINKSNPGLSAVTVSVDYNSNSNDYTISVPGQSGTLTSSSPDFGVDVYNSNTGATKLTIASGAVSSTAAFNFTGGNPTYVSSFSPVTANLVSGQSTKATLTVEDNQGNPVANTEVKLYSPDANNPLWITSVNGVTLSQTEPMTNNSSSSEPTPIPLNVTQSVGYGNVDISGVVSWTAKDPAIWAYTDANGQVTLTLQNGGVSYYDGMPSTVGYVYSSKGSSAGSENFWTYKSDTAASTPDLSSYGVLAIGGQSSLPTNDFSQSVGTVTFGSGSGSVSSSSTGVNVTGAQTQAYKAGTPGVGYISYPASPSTGDSVTIGGVTFTYGQQFNSESTLISAINNENNSGLVSVTASQDSSNSSVIDLSNTTGAAVSLSGSGITTSSSVPAGNATPEQYTLTVNSGALSAGTLNGTVNGKSFTVTVTQFESASGVANGIVAAINGAGANVTAAIGANSNEVVLTQNPASSTGISASVQG